MRPGILKPRSVTPITMVLHGVRAAALAAPLLMILAGCLETPIDTDSVVEQATEATTPLLSVGGSECWEGGFVAAYQGSGDELSGGWVTANIREEIGNPMRDGLGTPLTPDATLSGNWHQGIKCKTATFNGETLNDFMFGFVGDSIEAPAFDPGGADLHFVVSVTSLEGGTAPYTIFRETTKAGISPTTVATIDYYAGDATTPRAAAYVAFATDENGIYESYSNLAYYRDVEPRTVRLWWTVPVDGSQSPLGSHHLMEIPEGTKWHPVYFDIVTQGGRQITTPPVDSVEAGCHAGIDDHGPQGRLCQPTLTNIYEHTSLEFKFGGLLNNVVLDEYWHH